jgi:phage baseplate assembly protein V
MAGEFIASTGAGGGDAESRFQGVVLGRVVSNVDLLGLHRVQVQILPGIDVWAHVAVPTAGSQHGTYLIPQVGDQVVVAFVSGDVRAAVVIGSVWNSAEAVPVSSPTDAVTKRVLRTPAGHELSFDDAAQSVTLTTSTQQKITVDPARIELSAAGGQAKVTLEGGRITLEAALGIHLKAPIVSTEARALDLSASELTRLTGSKACEVQADLVRIN